MRATILSLLFAVFASGCATVGSIGGGGLAGYYSNADGGPVRFRITDSLRGYQMSAFAGAGEWSSPQSMKRLSLNDPALKNYPWLAQIVESAYGIDGFTFLQFRQGAQVGGQTLPTSYYLAPGGFAYKVPPPAAPSR